MEFEPDSLSFQEVRLNQAYTTSLCVSNPLNAPVDFVVSTTSARVKVSPSKVHLNAGQSIVLTVRLFLNHFPPASREGKQITDYLMVKSVFFDHKIPVSIRVVDPAVRSRSPSPAPGKRKGEVDVSKSSYTMRELNMRLELKDKHIQELESVIGMLRALSSLLDHCCVQFFIRYLTLHTSSYCCSCGGGAGKLQSKYPDLEDIIQSRLEVERAKFEEHSEKVPSLHHFSCLVSRFFLLSRRIVCKKSRQMSLDSFLFFFFNFSLLSPSYCSVVLRDLFGVPGFRSC